VFYLLEQFLKRIYFKTDNSIQT